MSNNTKKKKPAKTNFAFDAAAMAAKVAFRKKILGAPYAEHKASTEDWAKGHTHVHGTPAFIWGNHEPFKPRQQLTVQMDFNEAVTACRVLTDLKWFLKGYKERDFDGDSDIKSTHILFLDGVIRDIEHARAEHTLKAKEAEAPAK